MRDDALSLEGLIHSFEFSDRALRWLRLREGITRLDQLTRYTRAELLSMPGLGPGTVARLEAAMARHNLYLDSGDTRDP